MSQRLRCLHTSLRAFEKAPASARTLSARAAPAARRALHASASTHGAQAALAPRTSETDALLAEASEPNPPVRAGRRNPDGTPAPAPHQVAHDAHLYPESKRHDSSRALSAHMNRLLRPLEFPPELARRILTHASHRDAVHGHNQRLSFMGRRALEAYFLLFLHGTPRAPYHADHAALAERALNSYAFGEHIGTRWEIARVLRWTPPDAQRSPHREPLPRGTPFATRGVGLYKVTGTAVEAVVGGVFHQFGGNVAHKLFHTRILPLLPNVPEPFRSHALELCERMGGENAPLLPQATRAARKASEAKAAAPEAAVQATPAPVEASSATSQPASASTTTAPAPARTAEPVKVARTPSGPARTEEARTERRKLAL